MRFKLVQSFGLNGPYHFFENLDIVGISITNTFFLVKFSKVIFASDSRLLTILKLFDSLNSIYPQELFHKPISRINRILS